MVRTTFHCIVWSTYLLCQLGTAKCLASPLTDSLKQAIVTTDSNRLHLRYALGQAYFPANPDSALAIGQQLLTQGIQTQNTTATGLGAILAGNAALLKNELPAAQIYAEQAIQNLEHTTTERGLPDAYLLRSKIHQAQGALEKAYYDFKQYCLLSDTLLKQQGEQQLQQLQQDYEVAKMKSDRELREQTQTVNILRIQQQRVVQFGLGSGVVLVVVTVILLFILYRNIKAENLKAMQLQEELKQLQTFKRDMTDMIVHDLKNPLATIIGTVGIVNDPKKQGWIKAAGQRMMNFIHNMQDLRSFEKANMQVRFDNYLLHELVQDVTDEMAKEIERKSIRLENEIQATAEGYFDRGLVRRVLVNLMTNAIKFTPQGGSITLFHREIEQEGVKMNLVGIKDTGEGISEEALETIFGKYQQAEARALGISPSTGLGLAFCKQAVEAHGGRIWAESNKGATFQFTLPAKRYLV